MSVTPETRHGPSPAPGASAPDQAKATHALAGSLSQAGAGALRAQAFSAAELAAARTAGSRLLDALAEPCPTPPSASPASPPPAACRCSATPR